jgi:hypothetical protein
MEITLKHHSLFILLCLLFFLADPLGAKEKVKRPESQTSGSVLTDEVTDFKNSRAWKKVDDSLKSAWINAMNTGNRDLKLECFVRVEPPADEGDESFLINRGFIVQIFAGNIARGHMKARDLKGVAELPFVQKVSLAKPPDKSN